MQATSQANELNDVDWHNITQNILIFDLPTYLITMANLRLAGNTWENCILWPLPVFCMAIIDAGKKFWKDNHEIQHD